MSHYVESFVMPEPKHKQAFHVEGRAVDAIISTLQAQLAASQERERILREGIRRYADRRNWTAANARSKRKDSWVPGIFGYDIAERTLKAAEEVKGCTGK